MNRLLRLLIIAPVVLWIACGKSFTPVPTAIPDCDTTNGLPPSKELDVAEGLEYRFGADVMCKGVALHDDGPTGPYVWVTARGVDLEASAGLVGGEELILWTSVTGDLPTPDPEQIGWPSGYQVEATWEPLECDGICHGMVARTLLPVYAIPID